MAIEKQIAANRRTTGHSRVPRGRKMNLNKRTHFDEANKALIPQTPISKPIYNPFKTQKMAQETHPKANLTRFTI